MAASIAIQRKFLLTAALGSVRSIERVEIKQIELARGQVTGLHRHPCQVVGYVAAGSINFQIDGKPMQCLRSGGAFLSLAMCQSPISTTLRRVRQLVSLFSISSPAANMSSLKCSITQRGNVHAGQTQRCQHDPAWVKRLVHRRGLTRRDRGQCPPSPSVKINGASR
jgi:hypothetical protein